jgi:hypothetical protein
MGESFPSLEVIDPEDEVTINRLINYLEEFQQKRNDIVNVRSFSYLK